MLVSAVAVLALALSAIAAPLGVPPKITDPHAQGHNLTTTSPPGPDAHGVAPPPKGLMITSPGPNDAWTDGQKYPVTWTTPSVPADELKQMHGTLLLGHPDGQLDHEHPLAEGFPLDQGSVMVIPNSPAGDYFVALLMEDPKHEVNAKLFKSAQFTITSPDGNTNPNKDADQKDKVKTPQSTGSKPPQGKN